MRGLHRALELDLWAARLLIAQLSSMGVRPEMEFDRTGIHPQYSTWWSENALPILRSQQVPAFTPDQSWTEWESVRPGFMCSGLGVRVQLLETCLRHLPGILKGAGQAKEILFPNGSTEVLEDFYCSDAVAESFESALVDLVERCVRTRLERDPGVPIRLIEIGSRTSILAVPRLARYAKSIPEYCCTHVAKPSLVYGQTRMLQDHPFLRYRPFDIERSASSEDLQLGSYDVAIASNVVHAASHIGNAIQNVKSLLRRNGLLLLNEITEKSVFSCVTFGLLWTKREDDWLRIPGSPLLAAAAWRRSVEQQGFRFASLRADKTHPSGQQIFLAESDGLIARNASEAAPQKVGECRSAQPSMKIAGSPRPIEEHVSAAILAALSETLKIPAAEIDRETPFADYGIDSILGSAFMQRVNEALALSMNFAVLFDHTTVQRLTKYISEAYAGSLQPAAPAVEQTPAPEPPRSSARPRPAATPRRHVSEPPASGEIAVVGMSGQFPGAPDAHAFWTNLIEGRDCVGELPSHYLNQGKFFATERQPGKTYCKWGGVLEERACFDPLFFHISPRDAETMSPHQRLILQESWKALEDAGCNPKKLADSATGIFIGAEPGSYSNQTFIGSSDAIIASRLSYFLNLSGPALVVNTGCSSSASAIHLACESLRSGECRVALAGGVLALIDDSALVRLSQIEMLSPTGRCRTFDASADGMVLSEAVAVVVLKRLDQAIADGDPIWGVLVASGMNQDGSSNGITAPSGSAQEQLITSLYHARGIDPDQITFFETHGTGTRLGDPVEANALVRAFRHFTRRSAFCAIGSAKAHIGHTAAAAGVVSLIKILLSLRYERIPGLLHFEKLNPLIEFEGSPFLVHRGATEWRRVNGQPRMAALNSFGHSGTNVHLVIREFTPDQRQLRASSGPMLVPLSARTAAERDAQVLQLGRFLIREHDNLDFASLAWTLQVGREEMEHRVIFLAKSNAELRERLQSFAAGRIPADCWTGKVSARPGQEPAPDLAGGSLADAARAWCEGRRLDWKSLHPEGSPPRISLPPYPFAKERYWIREDAAATPRAVPEPPIEDARKTELMTFEEVWEESDASGALAEHDIRNVVCLLSAETLQAQFREVLRELAPGVRVLFISAGPAPASTDTFPVAIGDRAAWEQAFRAIQEACGSVDAIVNLWAFESADRVQDPAFLVFLLKAIHANGLSPSRILSAAPFSSEWDRCHLESWIGFERSLKGVLPGTSMAAVYQDQSEARWPLKQWVKVLWTELQQPQLRSVLYRQRKRCSLRIRPVEVVSRGETLIKQGGTYVLTGGAGGLGLLFAERLASHYDTNVILTGRSPASAALQARLERMRRPGRIVHYAQADVCDREAMERVRRTALEQAGAVHGLIHLAGVEGKGSLFENSLETFQEVMDPKVRGTLLLDEIFADEPLDFVCYFSSSAAILGDLGSCDYSIGNRFQMEYARYRNVLCAQGKRHGKTVVMNWPFWRDGGMGTSDAGAAHLYLRTSGQRYLEVTEGIDLFERLLAGQRTQHLILAGEPDRIRRFLGVREESGAPHATAVAFVETSLEESLCSELKDAVNELLNVPQDRLDATANMADFGFDSIGLADFARLLTRRLGVAITPALFFGRSTLEALSRYLADRHGDVLRARYEKPVTAGKPEQAKKTEAREIVPPPGITLPLTREPIAIIGMSGRFPQARDVQEMWDILAAGRNAVEEIPAERFDWRTHYGDPARDSNKTNCRWCGCIPGVAEFDPLFFEISPDDAEKIDPRQRHLLQEAWKALEDAGYGAERLASGRVGMFVGVEEGDYQERVRKSERMVSNHDAVLSARLPYFLNLRGPVIAVNTACSSSAVAVHQACLSLQAGECDTALVGGVNLLLDPERLVVMTQAGMLSSTGRCQTFDGKADGFVPGEAIAVVVLKRLSAALADGDPVYAVIRGAGINYDGKTNGITAPSGIAQAELIREVWQRAGVRPADIDYVVAHGTGTKLGDPVEFNALHEVFSEDTDARHCCAVTSVKTNFGHSFAASGLVSLIGLAQALRHEQIPPSLHCEQENDFMEWRESPLFVNKSLRPWPRTTGRKRRGAVSAFGMSGTNVHLIVEEFEAEAPAATMPGPHLLVFSAKTETALGELLEAMARALEGGAFTECDLSSIAYTLLDGRHHFRYRCALVVNDLSDAVRLLKQVKNGDQSQVFRGHVARGSERRPGNGARAESLQTMVASEGDSQVRREALLSLAELYCQGDRLDAAALSGGRSVRRCHLPTYPFARGVYWIGQSIPAALDAPVSSETFLYLPRWEDVQAVPRKGQSSAERCLILLCEPDPQTAELLKRSIPAAQVVALHHSASRIEERFRSYVWQTLEALRRFREAHAGRPVLVQLVVSGAGERRLLRGLKGILDSASLEHQEIFGQLIEASPEMKAEQIRQLVEEGAGYPQVAHVSHEGNRRTTLSWERQPLDPAAPSPWKDQGIYLITGGLGALGLLVAAEIAEQVRNPTLILVGRATSLEKEARIESLRSRGARVRYVQADVASEGAVTAMLDAIVAQYGGLNGIVHCAGVTRDSYIRSKTQEEVHDVLAAKVNGLVSLDRSTRTLPLDFLVCFSSVAAVAGNAGQADYAAANAFMDAYAEYRNTLVQAGERSGLTLSINWPLWRNGGMRVARFVEEMMAEQAGMVSLETRPGLLALRQALAAGVSQAVVAAGDPELIGRYLRRSSLRLSSPKVATSVEFAELDAQVLRRLSSVFCELTKLRTEQVHDDEPLEAYGIDSFLINRLNQALSRALGDVSKTIFYEFRTLQAAAAELARLYPAQCARWVSALRADHPAQHPVPAVATSPSPLLPEAPCGPVSPIAIVGMSGCFPGAPTLTDFWDNLTSGAKSIIEIPPERWALDEFYCPDATQAVVQRKSCGKWGGLLRDFDQFDPLFFGITPREAENMDPQERRFLEESWKALEDAGYSPAQLPEERRRRTGVFAGITKAGFNLRSSETKTHLPSTSFASVANRVSHHLNLQGPSMPVDTMCSSALVAIHEACEYLRSGRGDMAIAGAVNLYLHPSTYIGLSARRLLSETADSAAFSAAATGFVPGEGVGAVVLRRLDAAIADGDDVYAVIRGSAVNHDGKTAAYGTPNPTQQAAAIQQAMAQSALPPESISYIEMAASGSAMGDALEGAGLIQAFEGRAGDPGAYRLGSVKPNIGHGESVSGIAQLAKVVLCLRHRTLVPTLVSGDLNPNIDFARLPFQLQTRLEPWDCVRTDDVEWPRRAGITSAGAGGVNAHVIVEEYRAAEPPDVPSRGEAPAVLFVLSAKNRERLQESTRNWLAYLDDSRPSSLESIAWTLQVGRDPMPCRVAIVTRDAEDLKQQLREWGKRPGSTDTCFWGDADGRLATRDPARLRRAMEGRSLTEIGRLWAAGHGVDWNALHPGRKPRRLSGLPTYPFARRTCWIREGSTKPNLVTTDKPSANKAAEFYSLWAKDADRTFREEYLTFCPFEQRVPGFSMSRVFLQPERYPTEMALLQSKQIEMRQALFGEVDFTRISAVLDIGCGHGTDVIQIAAEYPHLRTDGFTITRAQADLGNARIAERGLSARARIHHADSAKDPFPDLYDLIIGIEVTFHIRDKRGLYANIARSLRPDGRVLLMDFLGNLRGAIADPRVEITVPTRAEWIELLSDAGLVIDRLVDVSPQVANFLYDPEVEQSVADLPQVAQDTYRNYANQAVSLERGWISYCLFTLSARGDLRMDQRREHNARMLAHPVPYPEALRAMQARQGHRPYPPSPEAVPPRRALSAPDELQRAIERVFSRILGFTPSELGQLTFEELGIGSVNAVELTEAINVEFDLHLSTSLIFECSTLRELTAHVAEELTKRPAAVPAAQGVLQEAPVEEAGRDPIAIIGLSCRSAGARNADEFWRLIREGRDAIREVDDPAWLEFFRRHSPTPLRARYGAMDDIESFDPAFFNISPKEAEAMDPAQRILLEESWLALEDAGCAASRLRGRPVGTFIGTNGVSAPMGDFSHFSMLGADSSILAARLAYHLDLKGPALAVNTACSSSLVAVDLACQALKANRVDLAIAGGITIYSHPVAFLCMNNARMLSPTGECRPFDREANGIVVGDGVGVVILKRLRDAVRDHDHIYGVIRGSGTNQDGQTSGITVPSFRSQNQLQESVYRDNQVPVEDIQYVETHGTATKLGDPIEIQALTQSFESFTDRRQFCAIGSLKANIGHTTAAAGVLGLIKVLLSLRAEQIPPSIHFSAPNEHIDFGRSAFFVSQTLTHWPKNSRGSRLAAVSSFGFSGTNAHLVVEEHPALPRVNRAGQPALIVLSAKSGDRLKEVASTLLGWLVENRATVDLHDLAWTLQEGRDAFDERLGMVVVSTAELEQKLERFLQSPEPNEFCRGQARSGGGRMQTSSSECFRPGAGSQDYERASRLWVQGVEVDWNQFYAGSKPWRIPIPVTKFSRKKFPLRRDFDLPEAAPALHPLVQSNTSTLKEIRFSSWLRGDEFFLADHMVRGQRILPAVAYLEMARAAVAHACGDPQARWEFRNIAWVQPIAMNGCARQIHIRLTAGDDQAVHYAVYSDSDGARPVLHAQGTACAVASTAPPTLDLEALRRACARRVEDRSSFQERAQSRGLELGPSFRAVEEVFEGGGQVLARLSIPSCANGRGGEFRLHPSMMDAALQSASALPRAAESGEALQLPFALHSLEVYGSSPERGWVWVRAAGAADGAPADRLDFDLCDEAGLVRVSMKGLCVRPYARPAVAAHVEQSASCGHSMLDRVVGSLSGQAMTPPAVHSPASAELQDLMLRILHSTIASENGMRANRLDHWWAESLNFLRAAGVLDKPEAQLDALWKEWNGRKEGWNQDPNLRVQVALLEATLGALPDLLAGRRQSTDVLFPRSSMHLVEGIYSRNSVAEYFNEWVARAVVSFVSERIAEDPSARIRILEVGAGTGGSTAAVLRSLRPLSAHVESYWYTDVSIAFLQHGKARYAAEAPFLNTRLFDVSKPPAGQEIPTRHFDLVIAANVLHATRDIRQTLRNTRAVMRDNGLLLLNELRRNSLFSHLTFGLLDGWWSCEDAPLRIPGCPALSAESWLAVLQSEGFGRVSFPDAGTQDLDQQIIVAETAAAIAQLEPEPESSPAPERREAVRLPAPKGSGRVTGQMVEQHVRALVRERVTEALMMEEADLRNDRSFSEYGVDSIVAVQLVNQINSDCGIQLPTTILFDYNNLDRLTRHIVDSHGDALDRLLGAGNPETDAVTACQPEAPPLPKSMPAPPAVEPPAAKIVCKEPIAVIGMSGRFAKSDTPQEFWQHLAAGTDLVGRVTRWDLAESYADGWSAGRDCLYGSFINDIDKFDALFFNISGIEARFSDPQQRVFLEEAWKALEDAGYAGDAMKDKRCGVYVGCAAGDYPRLFTEPPPAQAFWGNSCSVVPARIAYYLNLKGPAISVDTACSSSLVSIHLACQGLWTRETDCALAGGVFIQSTSEFYRMANQAGMLSPTGHCHTFDASADGFVPGEGVGVFVLKRLSEALADGDQVYGVIRGSGLNQDGSSNGITAPSAKSQEMLEREIYDEFQIHPESIQMVESHGTGTTLGDPIEFQALCRAFEAYTGRKQYCALGSVKTNIGHAATAAGAAGFMKVLLALRHEAIPPSLHFHNANPAIDLGNSPFFVNTTLRPWPVEGSEPRRAVISGFGFGGTNAHLVVEEAPRVQRHHTERPGYLVVLSARTAEQLRAQVTNLLHCCRAEQNADPGNIAFTLMVGRDHRSHRLACVVRSRNELISCFEKWLEKGKHPAVYVKEVVEREFREQASLKRFGNQCIESCRTLQDATEYLENLSTLADLYVQGYRLSWQDLFDGGYSRISLPTYPFAREHCWVSESDAVPNRSIKPAMLHPLAHRNTSSFAELRFTSTFTGEEFFFADHRVKGSKVLPGVAYLEMARAALELAGCGGPGLQLRDIVWVRPLVADGESSEVSIRMSRDENGRIQYAIFTAPAGGAVLVHSEGEAVEAPAGEASVHDLAARLAACPRRFSPEDCYAAYQALGIEYGPAHRGLQELHAGEQMVVARLSLPLPLTDDRERFGLHPALLDSAVQASICFSLQNGASPSSGLLVPYALESLIRFGPCPAQAWAVIQTRAQAPGELNVRKLDIDVCDGQGRVCVRMRGLTSRVLQGEAATDAQTLMFRPVWRERALARQGSEPATPTRRIVVLCEPSSSWRDRLESAVPNLRYVELCCVGTEPVEERFEEHAVRIFGELQSILQEKPARPALFQVITFTREEQKLLRGLSGMLRTASLENPVIQGQLIELENEVDVLQAVLDNAACPQDTLVRYVDGRRLVQCWEEQQDDEARILPWKEHGVYLITGGLGGLGQIVAREIAASVSSPTLILVGRSPQGEKGNRQLEQIESLGARVEYRQVDITAATAVEEMIRDIQLAFGALNGIVHAAGLIRDQFILRKREPEIREVIRPKVAGLLNLDRATQGLSLDFVVLFSSLSGVLGNAGQADYAAANAFLDAFAEYQADAGRGCYHSIAWPLWKDGGMRVDAQIEKRLEQDFGMRALTAEAGLGALRQALSAGHACNMVVSGSAERLRTGFAVALAPAPPPVEAAVPVIPAEAPKAHSSDLRERDLQERTGAYLKQIVCETLRVDASEVKGNQPLEKYGLDSILVLEINKKLEKRFPNLSKTLFFEYGTLDELTEYFVESHAAVLATVVAPSEPVRQAPPNQPPAPAPAAEPPRVQSMERPPAEVEAIDLSQLSVDEIIRAAGLNAIVHHKAAAVSHAAPDVPNAPFQSFAPFPAVRDGFSLSRLLLSPQACPEDARFVVGQQLEMRKVLFAGEDLNHCRRILDIGCGTGTDLMELAHMNRHLLAHGLTVSAAEARSAEERIRSQNLSSRVQVFPEANTSYRYEGSYDLVLSIQVMHFLNAFSAKNRLLETLSGCLSPGAKIFFAEFVGHTRRPMHDAVLNVTVSSVDDWAGLLGSNGFCVDQAIDASAEIRNFLDDPEIERNLTGLDEDRKATLRKYSQQVSSLRDGWVSYCLLKVRKDPGKSARELKEHNVRQLQSATPYAEARREMLAGEPRMSYRPDLSRILGTMGDSGPGCADAIHPAPLRAEPVLVHEKDLTQRPEAAAWLAAIDAVRAPTGYERSLYPSFFFTADRRNYVRLVIDEPAKLLIPLLPVGKETFGELCRYAEQQGQQVLLVDQFHESMDRNAFRILPMGVWQDIDIGEFTLKGGRMRKARYLVEKFRSAGEARCEEYDPAAPLPLSQMRELMIRWSEGKGNIIHHTFECMGDLLGRRLPPGHRAFLTYLGDQLCSVIVLGEGEGGRLVMDQEFYDPERAPLGHMEYAISTMIEKFRAEGVRYFSLGLTWYPFTGDDGAGNEAIADAEGWEWLKAQNERQSLLGRIFEQGRTNYQFKKKFAGREQPIVAYVPKNAPWSLVMKYWPVFYQNSLTVARIEEEIKKIPLEESGTIGRQDRLDLLRGGKLESLDYFHHGLDLITDSWYSARSGGVREQIAAIDARPRPVSDEALRDLFPFRHVILAGMGRNAEALFYQAFPKEREQIVTAPPWTTTLLHQIQNGFEIVERPNTSALSHSLDPFKGEMDLNGLEQVLDTGRVGMAGLELLNNATGGHAVRLSHLLDVRKLLVPRGIPLVLDASRVVRNAVLLQRHDPDCASLDVWEIVRRLLLQADHVVTSLTKDFTAWRGGLIATNDDGLAGELRRLQSAEERESAGEVESIVLRALADRDHILRLVRRQMHFAERLHAMLTSLGVPVLQPGCGHALVLDASPFAPERANGNGRKIFLERLFIEAGIRASVHQPGRQRNTLLDRCIRLAIPLGLKSEDEEQIFHSLERFFRSGRMVATA